MWEDDLEKMLVKVFWFYHPEETASGFKGDLPYPVSTINSDLPRSKHTLCFHVVCLFRVHCLTRLTMTLMMFKVL